jgi:hypothetical protein
MHQHTEGNKYDMFKSWLIIPMPSHLKCSFFQFTGVQWRTQDFHQAWTHYKPSQIFIKIFINFFYQNRLHCRPEAWARARA